MDASRTSLFALTPDGKWVYTKGVAVSVAVNLKSGFYATKVTDEKDKCDKIVAYS